MHTEEGSCFVRLSLRVAVALTALIVAAGLCVVSATASAPPAPAVTAVLPNDGSPAGGNMVTINGLDFTGALAVKFVSDFGEEHDATSFTVDSDTSITAVSPAGYGVDDIRVVGPGGMSPRVLADRFGYGPILDEMTPQHGAAAGGASVMLRGFGLEGATGVVFGPNPAASFQENPDGSLTAVAPPMSGDETVVSIMVNTPQGPSKTNSIPDTRPANQFAYGPTVTGLSPGRGPSIGGSLVIIHGTGFESPVFTCLCGPFVHAVYFGAARVECGWPRPSVDVACAPLEFIVDSDTEITAIAPPGSGAANVVVATDGGGSPISSDDEFVYESTSQSAIGAPENVCAGDGSLCSSADHRRYMACVFNAREAFHRSSKAGGRLPERVRTRAMSRARRRLNRAIIACRSTG